MVNDCGYCRNHFLFCLFSYTLGLGDKYQFDMALLLCVYYEYYCQNVSSLIHFVLLLVAV